MRTLVHISDIHFGRVNYEILDPLVDLINGMKPDVVVISGDLTQRARAEQFKEAKAFLDRLPQPQIVIPGNHDVPLYNVFKRFFQPLDNYLGYITKDLEPFYKDDEMVIVGVNTARSLTFKGGRINEEQVARIKEKLCVGHEELTKIVVTHHPFDVPPGHDEDDLLGRAEMALGELAPCGADLFLAGHLHVDHIGNTAKRYDIKGYSALLVQAGTATSTRARGASNSFNLIRIDHPYLTVEPIIWNEEKKVFEHTPEQRFEHTPNGWVVSAIPITGNEAQV